MVAERKLRKYLSTRTLRKSSREDYVRIFRRMNQGAFGGDCFPPPDDARERMVNYLYYLAENDYSPVTIRNQLTVAKYYFACLGMPEVLAGLRSPVKVRKQLTRPLLPREVDRLLKALAKEDRRSAEVFEFMLLSGLRLSELLGLDCTRFEVVSGCLRVKVGPGRPRRPVVIGERAIELVVKWLKSRDGMPKGETDRLKLTRSLRTVARRIGLGTVTPSRIRMTYGVRMLAAGVDADFVSLNMGLDRSSYESRRRMKEVLAEYLMRVSAEMHDDEETTHAG